MIHERGIEPHIPPFATPARYAARGPGLLRPCAIRASDATARLAGPSSNLNCSPFRQDTGFSRRTQEYS